MVHGVVDFVDTTTNCIVLEKVLVSYEQGNRLKVYSDSDKLLFRILKLKFPENMLRPSDLSDNLIYEIFESFEQGLGEFSTKNYELNPLLSKILYDGTNKILMKTQFWKFYYESCINTVYYSVTFMSTFFDKNINKDNLSCEIYKIEDCKFICPCIKSTHLYKDIKNEIVNAMYKNHRYQNFTVHIDTREVEEFLELNRIRENTAYFLVPIIIQIKKRSINPSYNILKMRA